MIVEPFPGLDRSRRRLQRLHRAAPVDDDPTAMMLSLRAAELLRAVQTGTIVPSWRSPGFGREVDGIRAQLRPIGLRATLAASFGREAGRRMDQRRAAATPLDLAYAVRWLELEPKRARSIPAWTSWLPSEPG